MKIIKFAFPLAALFCFTAVAPLAVAADSSTKKRTSSKKSATTKKSSKSGKSAQSRKSKGKSSTAKKKAKSDTRTAKAESQSWIDELPEVELPTISGPAEEELLETVDIVEVETEADSDEP